MSFKTRRFVVLFTLLSLLSGQVAVAAPCTMMMGGPSNTSMSSEPLGEMVGMVKGEVMKSGENCDDMQGMDKDINLSESEVPQPIDSSASCADCSGAFCGCSLSGTMAFDLLGLSLNQNHGVLLIQAALSNILRAPDSLYRPPIA